MAGGPRGPIPKRLEERRRGDRSETGIKLTQVETFAGTVKHPPADQSWEPLAVAVYESFEVSGQSQFYEPSDWAIAYVLCESLSRYLASDKRSPTMLATILSGFDDLLVTEGVRRRARMELMKPVPKDPDVDDRKPGVIQMEKFRSARGGAA